MDRIGRGIRRLFELLFRKKKKTPKVSFAKDTYRWVSPRLGSGEISFYLHRPEYWPGKGEWTDVSVSELTSSYRRDSFEDRICDDLCELILSFLDFGDKINFQWVCPQWRRLIFSKHTEISLMPFVYRSIEFASTEPGPLSSYDFRDRVDLFFLVPTLSVANNIRYVSRLNMLDNGEQVMEAIVHFCNRLQAIETDFKVSDELLEKFLQKFGHKMKKIIFTQILEQRIYTKVLRGCPNVEIVGRDYLIDKNMGPIYDGDELLTKNLKRFHFSSFQRADRIQEVMRSNKNTLTFVQILIWDSKHLYDEILNLPKLRKLVVNTVGDKVFVAFFTKLADNCPKLQKVRITVDYLSKELTDWKTFTKALNSLTYLKTFKMNHKSSSEWESPFPLLSKSIKDLQSLKTLKIIGNCFLVEDQFFEDIDVYLPKLQKLFLQCRNITGLTTQRLAKLRHLRFICLCQVMKSYMKDVFLNPYNSDYKLRPTVNGQDVIKLIHENRKIRRIFITTPSPGRLTCDLSDSDIEMIRQNNRFDLNTIFYDDGEERWDRDGWSRRPCDYDPKRRNI